MTDHRKMVPVWGVIFFLLVLPQTAAELTVHLTEPTEGQHVRHSTRILVHADDPDGVRYVAVYKDGAVMATDFSAPYEFAWNTQAEADGPHAVMAKAVSESLREAVTPRLTVTVDHTAPMVTLIAPADHATGVNVLPLEAAATDTIGVRAVTFFLDGAEVGTVTHAPYQFGWDSRQTPNGQHAVQARAMDRAGNDATSEAVTIWLANPNDPPVLEAPEPTTVLEGTPWTLQLKATEPNAPRDPILYSADKLPAWVTLDPHAGLLSGTPSFDEASRDAPLVPAMGLMVQACDPEPLCTKQPLLLSVANANRPPSLEPLGPQMVEDGELLVMHLRGTDPDGDPMVCRIKHLPPWMTFDGERCLARGIPSDEEEPLTEPETVYPEVIAELCDADGICASETVVVTVTGVGNQAPLLTVPAIVTTNEGVRLTLDVQAEDPEQDTPVLTAEPLPEGASFIDHTDGTGFFVWTPRYDQQGRYDVTFKAADPEKETTKLVRMVVKEASLAISGTIKDVFGVPVEGAIVDVSTTKEGTVRTATTNATGYYLATDLKPGVYTLAPSYALKTTFSAAARSQLDVIFSPPKTRVVLSDSDQTSLNFSATFP